MYRAAVDGLEERGLHIIEYPKATCAEFNDLIRQNAKHVDAVIIGGGDGTVLASLPAIVATKLKFGVIPMGTANNLARNLGIAKEMTSAIDVIGDGVTRRIDLGYVNGRYFLNVAGLGLSTLVNAHVPKELKRRWGVLAYVWYAFKVMRGFRAFSTQITADGETRLVRTMQITVCNGKYYGSGLPVAEDAGIDDGYLHLLSAEIRHWWQGFRLIPKMLRGTYDPKAEIRLIRGKEITIETRRPLRIDTDGEILTRTPAKFHIWPKAIEVFAPPALGEPKYRTLPLAKKETGPKGPAPTELSM